MNVQTVMQRNSVRVLGQDNGPALVLMQGFGCDQVIWTRLLPYFTDVYRVVLFDHVGTGGSDAEAYAAPKYAAMEGYLEDLAEIMDVLDLRDVTVVGHSIAGAMALAVSVQNPRIARLVLLCASPCYLNDEGYVGGFRAQDIERVLDAVESNYPLFVQGMSTAIAGADTDSAVTKELTANMCRLNPAYVRDFLQMSFTADVRQLLPQVAVPALILQSRFDPLTPESASQFLHQHLPHGTLVELKARGNMPHLSSPSETAAAILQYLKAVIRA